MEDKYKELISGSGGLRWQITSFNQQCQVRKTNDVYAEAVPCLKTAALALLTSLSRLVPAAVVGRSSGLYGLKRALNTSETPRADLVIPAGFGSPQP